MSWLEAIPREREAERVRTGLCLGPGMSVNQAFETFGLNLAEQQPLALGRDEARRVGTGLLAISLAYGCELMTLERAECLVDEFLNSFGDATIQLFSNGRWDWFLFGEKSSLSWGQMTGSTFDGGLLALSDSGAACFWIEEED